MNCKQLLVSDAIKLISCFEIKSKLTCYKKNIVNNRQLFPPKGDYFKINTVDPEMFART